MKACVQECGPQPVMLYSSFLNLETGMSQTHIFYPYFSVFYTDLFGEVFVFESLSLDMIRWLVTCGHRVHSQSHEMSCDVM